MASRANDGPTLVEGADRRFVARLPPGAQRDTVVASLVRYRAAETLGAGDALPKVTLRGAQDLETVSMSELVRGRPFLLVFGSFTWPPFRRRSGDVEALQQELGHAADEWQLPDNLEDGVVVNQQTTLEERRRQALATAERLGLSMPVLVDDMDNRASAAFAAWPERLVLVGADERIVYPGKPGPWGFSPEEARETLVTVLGAEAIRGRIGT